MLFQRFFHLLRSHNCVYSTFCSVFKLFVVQFVKGTENNEVANFCEKKRVVNISFEFWPAWQIQTSLSAQLTHPIDKI